MDERIATARDWLDSMPLRDNPAQLESHRGERPGTWDEWLGHGRRIVEIQSSLIWIVRNDSEPLLRSFAALALGFLGAEESVDPLIEVLEADMPLVQMEAAAALGRLESTRAVGPLCTALGSPDANVRANACMALGGFDDPRATACLEAAREDADTFVQEAAERALGER